MYIDFQLVLYMYFCYKNMDTLILVCLFICVSWMLHQACAIRNIIHVTSSYYEYYVLYSDKVPVSGYCVHSPVSENHAELYYKLQHMLD